MTYYTKQEYNPDATYSKDEEDTLIHTERGKFVFIKTFTPEEIQLEIACEALLEIAATLTSCVHTDFDNMKEAAEQALSKIGEIEKESAR